MEYNFIVYNTSFDIADSTALLSLETNTFTPSERTPTERVAQVCARFKLSLVFVWAETSTSVQSIKYIQPKSIKLGGGDSPSTIHNHNE